MQRMKWVAILATLVIGCGGGSSKPDAAAQPDGAPDGAGGPPDAGQASSCDTSLVKDLDDPTVGTHMGNDVQLMGTITNNPGQLDPKTGCTTGATKNEQVSKITVAAKSRLSVFVNSNGNFDPVVYLRTNCIDAQSEVACADTSVNAEIAAGTTVFIVVDAGSTTGALPQSYVMDVVLTPIVESGQPCDPSQVMNVCAAPTVCSVAGGTPVCAASLGGPTITHLDARASDNTVGVTLNLTGADPDGDVVAAHLSFTDMGGNGLDLDGNGVPDVYPASTKNLVGKTMFKTRLDIDRLGGMAVQSIATGTLTLVDSAGNMTQQTVPVTVMPTLGGPGAVCGTAPNYCAGEDDCAAMACATPASTTTVCAAADAAAAISASGTTMVHIDMGAPDNFQGNCYYTAGYGEQVLRVVVPGPAHVKLEAATNVAPSDMMLDTYVYLRSTCGDPLSQLACNDDVSGMDYRSDMVANDLAPGTYYLIVDGSSEGGGIVASGDIGVQITMTDLKNVGDACTPGTDLCVSGAQCFDPAGGTAGTCTTSDGIVTAECATAPIVVPGTAINGMIAAADPNTHDGSCAFSANWPEKYHLLTLTGKADIVASTDGAGTTVDTAVYVMTACAPGATEVSVGGMNACNDDIDAMSMPPNYRSSLAVTLDPGTYALVVDLSSNFGPDGGGTVPAPWSYTLNVTSKPVLGAGQPCDATGMMNRCDTGLTCTGTPATCM